MSGELDKPPDQPMTSELELKLKKRLESMEIPPDLLSDPEKIINLDPAVTGKYTFRKVLLFFMWLSEFLETHRSPEYDGLVAEDLEKLNRAEMLQPPKPKDKQEAKEIQDRYNLFWIVINQALTTGLPICVVLRSVEGSKYPGGGFRSFSECGEISLNLLYNYIYFEHAHSKKLFKKFQDELKSCGMDGIEHALPDPKWFLKEASSFYFHFYNYIPYPSQLNAHLQSKSDRTVINLTTYLHHITQLILGNTPSSHSSSSSSSSSTSTSSLPAIQSLAPESCKKVLEELPKVLAHVPLVIEAFWNHCDLLPVIFKFKKTEQDIVKALENGTRCSSKEALNLYKRIELILLRFSKIGVQWNEKLPRGDLIGLDLLLQLDLLESKMLETPPTSEQLQRLTSRIAPNPTGNEQVTFIVNSISIPLYRILNVACFKAKVNFVAGLVAHRIVVEKTWDAHIYLLRRDLTEYISQWSPKWKHHDEMLSDLDGKISKRFQTSSKSRMRARMASSKVTPTQKIFNLTEEIKQDAKKPLGILVVMMEINQKLHYISKTFRGEPVPFIEEKNVKLQGLDLKANARDLKKLIADAINECRIIVHKDKSVRVTIGLINTNTDAAGVLALAMATLDSNLAVPVFTLPLRILHFYKMPRFPMKSSDLLNAAWESFQSNLGFMSRKVSQMKAQTDQGIRYPLTEWEFQLPQRNLPLEMMSVLLNVAVANMGLCFQRLIMEFEGYAMSLQFLMNISSQRMSQIKASISALRQDLLEWKSREMLLEKFSKIEILKLIGLTYNETQLYSQFFHWNETYPTKNNLETRRQFFNFLMTEHEKEQLFKHLKEKVWTELDTTDKCRDRFINKLLTENEASFPGLTFDPDIITRVKSPHSFLRCKDETGAKTMDWFARFGTQEGELFKNVDYFSFKSHDVVRFVSVHLPVRTYLKPLLLTFIEDVEKDVVEFAFDPNKKDTPYMLAKCQAYVLCILNKNLSFEIKQDTNCTFEVVPMFQKGVNTTILDVSTPSQFHRFDPIASLLQLTFLDVGDEYRIAGRPVSTSRNELKEGLDEKELSEFNKNELDVFNRHFEGLFKSGLPQGKSVRVCLKRIPNFDKFYQLSPRQNRLKLVPSKVSAGFPVHLNAEYNWEYKPL